MRSINEPAIPDNPYRSSRAWKRRWEWEGARAHLHTHTGRGDGEVVGESSVRHSGGGRSKENYRVLESQKREGAWSEDSSLPTSSSPTPTPTPT